MSKVELKEDTPLVATLKKYRKATTGEAIQKSGADVAVAKTDNKLLVKVRNAVKKEFITNLEKGKGTAQVQKLLLDCSHISLFHLSGGFV